MSAVDRPPASRRRFLQGASTVVAAGIAGCGKPPDPPQDPPAPPPPDPPSPPAPPEEPHAAGVQRRRLGRTELEACVVAFGSGHVNGPHLLRRGIDEGINYLDTSMCYMGGRSEEIVGQAIRGLREQVIVATKWDVFPRHSKGDCMEMLEGSLGRLGVDHVDLLFLHQVGDHGRNDPGQARIDHPPLYEAMDQARTDGKVRYFGVSSHVGQRAQLLRHAIDTGAFDVILVSLAYGNFDGTGVPELLAHAAEKDIGVVGMKVNQGNQIPPELAGAGLDLYQSQLRWALDQGCHTVINTRLSNQQSEQDAALAVARSELRLTRRDTDLLRQYTLLTSASYCRGCSQHCQGACPEGVRIADVLRYRMYHKYYGDTEQAVMRYAALTDGERLASICGECNACSAACPHGLPVVEQLFEARRLMLA